MKIKGIVLFTIILQIFFSCTTRIHKDEFEKNYSVLKIKEISVEQFFYLRMRNRLTIRAESTFEIVKITDDYVFIAKTYKNSYSGIMKCKKQDLKIKFPHYIDFDGIMADKIINANTRQYYPKFVGVMKSDFKWVAEFKSNIYLFHLKWDYSINRGPLVKRNFQVIISKSNLKNVKVIEINS